MDKDGSEKAIYDLSEFIRLSAVLNYSLSARTINRFNLLTYILGEKSEPEHAQMDRDDKRTAMEALNYLFEAYRLKRRRLGPMAILHPLRATALYCRAVRHISLVDLLTLFFHDVQEDIRPVEYEGGKWKEMEEHIFSIFEKLPAPVENELITRLENLTKRDNESYFTYVGRLLGAQNPEKLVPIKLADRLDNTLDMRIDLEEPLEEVDFFKMLFQILYLKEYREIIPKPLPKQPSSAMKESIRLYQLFKNIVLLSMIREKQNEAPTRQIKILFDTLSDAGLKECQRIFVQLGGSHFKSAKLRPILLEIMEYAYTGGIEKATNPDVAHIADGLLSGYFGIQDDEKRSRKLTEMSEDKTLMVATALTFIVIFLRFRLDPAYYIKGITMEGVYPE